MGSEPEAAFAYGYSLGCTGHWKVLEVGERGKLTLPWYDESAGDDFARQAMTALRAAAGFTEDWVTRTGDFYLKGKREAELRAGVQVETRRLDGSVAFVLCAVSVHGDPADAGYVAERLAASTREWDERLAWALKALGLTPVQRNPAWLACSNNR